MNEGESMTTYVRSTTKDFNRVREIHIITYCAQVHASIILVDLFPISSTSSMIFFQQDGANVKEEILTLHEHFRHWIETSVFIHHKRP